MDKALNKTFEDYKKAIGNAVTSDDLEKIRIEILGRKGLINQLLAKIKDKNQREKRGYGKSLNILKRRLEKLITLRSTKVVAQKDKNQKEEKLYSLPKLGHLHPITLVENEINDLFKNLGFSVYTGPEIETDEFNFRRLNVPIDHPARNMQDTIYIREPEIMLRTQSSSIEARLLATEKPPFRTAFPGAVYRNEKVNRSNHFIFNQYQAVVVDKNITLADLIGTMDLMFKTLYGKKVITRYRCKYYPEVEPGVGPDMQCFSCHGSGCSLCKGAGWIEMGGAGIIHPNVLKKANINPAVWRGFAFGMGLDRLVMAKFNIQDIRTLLGGNLAYKPNKF